MKVTVCRPYHSKTVGLATLRMPDGRSVFRVYFLDIVGRDDPAKYEWSRGTFPTAAFEALFPEQPFEGVGFVTAFPHITKVFRFAPSAETVLHVRAFSTRTLEPLDLARDEGYLEFACYAEAAIAADEYHAWARAGSVEEYLRFRSAFEDGPVASHEKLRSSWDAASGKG